MSNNPSHIARRITANACRFLLAAAFIFSGYTKAIDPLGSLYKIQDYLAAFGMGGWFPPFFPLMGGIVLSAIEFSAGVFLLLGVRRSLATTLAMLLMCFMTPLTLYLALFNPVADCGCFGDAWVLTNWETFGKNIVLLAAAIFAFRWRRLLVRFFTRKLEWIVSLYTLLFVFILSFYCLSHLPVLDFRPYKVGTHIPTAMSVPEDAEPDVYETRFVLEKNGEQKEFTLDNYPDSTWTFVARKDILVKKGYEPPIRDFAVTDPQTGEDITQALLNDTTYTFLLIAHRLEQASDSYIDLINEVYDYAVDNGYRFCCLTSSPQEVIALWRDRTGAEYPFYMADDITLKTIVRSNPGLLLIKNGTILNKWSDTDIPNEYELNGRLEDIPLGQLQTRNGMHAIGYVCLWFAAPLFIVLTADLLIVRRKERKRRQRQKKGKNQNQ